MFEFYNPRFWCLFLAIIVLGGTLSCGSPAEHLTLNGQTMGTTYHVSIANAPRGLSAREVGEAVEDTLSQVNSQFSNWLPDSDVSRFNRHASTDPFTLSDAFHDLLDIADEVHSASDGYFDLTLAPVVELWGFGPEARDKEAPTAHAIEQARLLTGQKRVLRRDRRAQTLTKMTPSVSLNVASIAKGAGIDALAQQFIHLGLTDFMIEIGGDLRVVGLGPRGTPWRIGIETPAASRAVSDIVTISNRSMATSGDYRNYFDEDGVRYSHILDATTGRPITHSTASVTVLADTAARADAWATALLAAGRKRGVMIAEQQGIAALFLDRTIAVDAEAPARPANTDHAPIAFERYTTRAFDELAAND
ncbi:MAG: FAD:protein FMN transferase [Pseudomonadota bacterium]